MSWVNEWTNEHLMKIGANPFVPALQRLLAVKGARTALIVAGAALLVALLGYLYLKTHGADVKRKNEVLTLLRELKEIDVRWDMDLWRMRTEFKAPPPAVPDTKTTLTRVQRDLASAAQGLNSPALTNGLTDLQKAFAQKAEMVDQYRGVPPFQETRQYVRLVTEKLRGPTELVKFAAVTTSR